MQKSLHWLKNSISNLNSRNMLLVILAMAGLMVDLFIYLVTPEHE